MPGFGSDLNASAVRSMQPLKKLDAAFLSAAASIAGLHGNPVAETGSSGVFVGSDLEIHLADIFASRRGERTELGSGARWRFHGLIHHFHVAAISELEIGLDRVSPGRAFGGIGGEKELEAFAWLIDQEIGVPVGSPNGIADQAFRALNLLFDDVGGGSTAVAANRHEEVAPFRGRWCWQSQACEHNTD